MKNRMLIILGFILISQISWFHLHYKHNLRRQKIAMEAYKKGGWLHGMEKNLVAPGNAGGR